MKARATKKEDATHLRAMVLKSGFSQEDLTMLMEDLTRKVEFSQEDLTMLMATRDKNKDCVIDCNEFLSWVARRIIPPVRLDDDAYSDRAMTRLLQCSQCKLGASRLLETVHTVGRLNDMFESRMRSLLAEKQSLEQRAAQSDPDREHSSRSRERSRSPQLVRGHQGIFVVLRAAPGKKCGLYNNVEKYIDAITKTVPRVITAEPSNQIDHKAMSASFSCEASAVKHWRKIYPGGDVIYVDWDECPA